MPTAATSQKGPQAVEPYNYPEGEADDYGFEWVYRSAWITDDTLTPGALHTFEVTDDKGGLPIEDQPTKIDMRMGGINQYHTKVTLRFTRRRGGTGPYQLCSPTLTPPPGPGQPHTEAQ